MQLLRVASLAVAGAVLVALFVIAMVSAYTVDISGQLLHLSLRRLVVGVYSSELVARVAVTSLCFWKLSRVVGSCANWSDFRVVMRDRAFLLILALFALLCAQLDNRFYWWMRVVTNGDDLLQINVMQAHRSAYVTLCVNCVGVLLLNFRTVLGAFHGLLLLTVACAIGFFVSLGVVI
jgi:hypothetical protein